MSYLCLSILLFLIGIYHVDAFLPLKYQYPRYYAAKERERREDEQQQHTRSSSSVTTTQLLAAAAEQPINGNHEQHKSISSSLPPPVSSSLKHSDILWKLRPPPDTPLMRRILLRLASNTLRLDCILRRRDLPFCMCPKGGQAVLEAHVVQEGRRRRKKKVARFGISTRRGPPAREISETVEQLYDIPFERQVHTAAIIYMFVEEPYRKQNIGGLALEVISTIHALQGCDFTVLVADDDGSGRLVSWYEQQGFRRAPKLQTLLGSPDMKYGVTMIKPTCNVLDPSCRLQWW